MKRTAFRFAAGTLALALPLAAVAACGVEKKRTVGQELAAAQDFLADSKAASVTLRFDDDKGNLVKAMTKGDDMPAAVAKALAGGSITYVVDAAGDATLRSMSAGATSTDAAEALKKVNLAFVIKDDTAELVEIRMVKGTLYAHLNLDEVGRLAEAGGAEDFDAMLDESLGGMDPALAQGLQEVRAGKWLKLPLADYLDDLDDLLEGYDAEAFGRKAWEAVKPHVTATDANDDSSDRVIDVRVKARPALKALLALLKAEKELPFASFLGGIAPADIDEHVADGEAKGTIRLKDSHLTQVALDLESLRTLSTEPGTTSFAGVRVVLDIDDSADEVTAPTDVASVDLGELVEGFLGSAFGGLAEGGQLTSPTLAG